MLFFLFGFLGLVLQVHILVHSFLLDVADVLQSSEPWFLLLSRDIFYFLLLHLFLLLFFLWLIFLFLPPIIIFFFILVIAGDLLVCFKACSFNNGYFLFLFDLAPFINNHFLRVHFLFHWLFMVNGIVATGLSLKNLFALCAPWLILLLLLLHLLSVTNILFFLLLCLWLFFLFLFGLRLLSEFEFKVISIEVVKHSLVFHQLYLEILIGFIMVCN